jgi:hypothetical protein
VRVFVRVACVCACVITVNACVSVGGRWPTAPTEGFQVLSDSRRAVANTTLRVRVHVVHPCQNQECVIMCGHLLISMSERAIRTKALHKACFE